MRRLYTTGLCLMALVAFGAVVAGSAYAEPEFTNATHAFPLGFTGEGGRALFTTKNVTFECEKLLDKGQILAEPNTTHSMLGDVQFLFDKCPYGPGQGSCSNEGSNKILTPEYRWHLGTLTTAANGLRAVLILVPFNPKLTLTCGGEPIEVGGNLVGLILDVNARGESQFNVRRKTIEIEFKSIEDGKQEERTFEFTLPHEVFTELDLKWNRFLFGEELLALEVSDTLTVEGGGEVELKA